MTNLLKLKLFTCSGMLLGLRHFGYPSSASHLAQHLKPLLSSQTNTISAAHLVAAGDGQASCALHDVIHHWRNRDQMRLGESIQTALSIGHSSGADGLLGIRTIAGALAALLLADGPHFANARQWLFRRNTHPFSYPDIHPDDKETIASC